MPKLYLLVNGLKNAAEVFCGVETAVLLYLYQYLNTENVDLVFCVTEQSDHCMEIEVKSNKITCISEEVPIPVSDCELPAYLEDNQRYCVAGLCATARELVKGGGRKWISLLGYRQSCLSACAESSELVKLCEIDLVGLVKKITLCYTNRERTLYWHDALFRCFGHLENMLSRAVQVPDRVKRLPDSRRFLNGYVVTLADLICFIPIHILICCLKISSDKLPPLLNTWYRYMYKHVSDLKIPLPGFQQEFLERFNSRTAEPEAEFEFNNNCDFLLNHFERTLNLSGLDNSRNGENEIQGIEKHGVPKIGQKSAHYTKQKDIEEILEKLCNIPNVGEWHNDQEGVDWCKIPHYAHPKDLPKNRVERKMQQIESFIKPILKIAKPSDVIVDFCCGCGHVGILLAYLLPQCCITVLDNRKYSLSKAMERVEKLGLNNVYIIQSNVDYFKGKFDIGVALHACGIATDVVITKCIVQGASCVVSPCCYGKIKANHILTYPRSSYYHSVIMSSKDYMVLAHSADQTHTILYEKSSQGEKCMDVVDVDRCLYIEENGYHSYLSKMIPLECSPKHNIIVGVKK